MTEYLVRFLVGGVVVSAFAMLGDVLRPKSFAGLFGAAPSVALATLGIAVYHNDAGYAATQSHSMMAGAIALGVYACDVGVLPAGTGHQCLPAADDFLVVCAYPPGGTYDECTTVEDRPRALKTIPRVGASRKDPVYGAGGQLSKLWKKVR